MKSWTLASAALALCAGAALGQSAEPARSTATTTFIASVASVTSPASVTPANTDLSAAAAAPPAPRPRELPREVQATLPQARVIGAGRLKVWGFSIYDAQLWALPGFSAKNYFNQPLALELAYLRDFTAREIAQRSIQEIRRSAVVSDAQAAKWDAALLRVLVDIKKGDRVVGVHRPGSGLAVWVNGQTNGAIEDAELARRFFGIWLSPETSEPGLREALLAGAAP